MNRNGIKCSHFLFLVKKNSLISQNFRFLKNIHDCLGVIKIDIMFQISMHKGANCFVSDLTKIEELEFALSRATVSFQHPPKASLFSPDFYGFEWLISRNQLERVWSCSVTIQLVLITVTFWFFVIKEKSHWFECVGWHASTLTTWGRRWRNLEITKKVQKRQLHQCNHTLHDLAGMKTSSFNFCLNLS